MSEAELRDWMTFYGLEPWGSDLEFYRTGIVAAMIFNTSQARGRKPPMKPTDFMPQRKPAASGLDPKAVKASLFAAFGDRIKPSRKDGR